MMQRSRHTIQAGLVVTYAERFQFQGNAKTTWCCHAKGPFEVSVSRNAIVVHRATLTTVDQVSAFQQAMHAARRQFDEFQRAAEPGVLVQCEVFEVPGG